MSAAATALAEVEFELTDADYRRHYMHSWLGRRRMMRYMLIAVIFLALICWLLVYAGGAFSERNGLASSYFGFVAGYLIAVAINARRASNWVVAQARKNAIGFGPRSVKLYSDHIATTAHDSSGELAWNSILSIEADRWSLYLYTVHRTAVIVPRRAFGAKRDCDEFIEVARRLIGSRWPARRAIASPASHVSITFVPTIDELTNFALATVRFRDTRRFRLISSGILAASPTACALVLNWSEIVVLRDFTVLAFCGVYCLLIVAIALSRERMSFLRASMAKAMGSPFNAGPLTIRFGADGCWSDAATGSTFSRWSRLIDISSDPTGIYVLFRGGGGTFIPASVFRTPQEKDRLLDIIQSYRRGNPVPAELLVGLDLPAGVTWPPAPSQITIG